MNKVLADVNVTHGHNVAGGSKVLLVPVDTLGAAEVAVVVATVPKEKCHQMNVRSPLCLYVMPL